MIINDELKNFVVECSKQHSPFKRENDNKKYQEKYIEIFELIYSKLPDLNSSIHLECKLFKKCYRKYKEVLFDLYNDEMIFFCTSSSGSLIHGNVGFSSEFKGDYSQSFSSFYKIDKCLIDKIINNNYNYTNKLNKIKLNKQITNKFKQIKCTPSYTKLQTENNWYEYLTDTEGNKIMEELPHFGQYTDGRIYSKFHTMKRDIRKNLKLCGSKIKEVFDISHCYPTLIGVLIGGHLDEDIVNSYRKYIMNNDIYLDALDEAGLPKTKENRNKIKPYFNKFILSTIKDNKRNLKWEDKTNDPIIFSAVVNFFKNKFPEVFDFIWNYETEVKKIDGKCKRVKAIAHHLQIIEKFIVESLTSLLGDIPYITLHDAIYIGEDTEKYILHINFEKEFRKILNF